MEQNSIEENEDLNYNPLIEAGVQAKSQETML